MRHKWEKKINHPYCHKFICVKCGCLKDQTKISATIYQIDDKQTYNAPVCDERLLNSDKNHERSVATEDDSSTKAGKQNLVLPPPELVK